jgi:hypothetical protein
MDKEVYFSDALHRITLHTDQKKPILESDLRALAERGVRNLPVRYPGLKVVEFTIQPNRVELLLDFQRLDEDVLRVVQSFKSEVKNLAKKKGFAGDNLWQWEYEDVWVPPPAKQEEQRS